MHTLGLCPARPRGGGGGRRRGQAPPRPFRSSPGAMWRAGAAGAVRAAGRAAAAAAGARQRGGTGDAPRAGTAAAGSGRTVSEGRADGGGEARPARRRAERPWPSPGWGGRAGREGRQAGIREAAAGSGPVCVSPRQPGRRRRRASSQAGRQRGASSPAHSPACLLLSRSLRAWGAGAHRSWCIRLLSLSRRRGRCWPPSAGCGTRR